MLVSALLYLGLIAGALGTMFAILPPKFLGIRRRSAGVGLLAAGLATVVVIVLLPVRAVRLTMLHTELDRNVPAYQFREVHSVRIAAPRDRVDRAIRQVTAGEIPFFRALTWIRRLGQPAPEGILNAPERVPVLGLATRTGFMPLADKPGREIVIGTLVMAPEGWQPPPRPTGREFRSIRRAGFAVAAMNFLIEDAGGGACTLTTETRVYATDPGTCRRFAAYWRFIYPGSALIRRSWLDAIRRRAEAPAPHAVRRDADAATMPRPPLPEPPGAPA